MDFQGSQLLQHPAPTVWRALMDPAVLQQCIAGCEKFEYLGGDDYSSTVKVSIGPVAARFTSKLSLSDLVEPTSCSLHFSGQGGVAGFGKGTAKLQLVQAEAGQTQLNWTAQAQVGGKLAQIGSRLVEGSVRKMSDDFFAKLAAYLNASPAEAAKASQAALQNMAADALSEKRSTRLLWLLGGVVTVLAWALLVWLN